MISGIVLLCIVAIWIGCSGDNPAGPDATQIANEVATGQLSGQVGAIEGETISIRLLQNGKLIATVEADAAGNYQFSDIRPGTYTVQITAKGYQTQEFSVAVNANQIALLKPVMLKPMEGPVSHIRGLLTDQATKKPLVNVRLQLTDNQGMIHEALTAQTGGFTFENLPANEPFILKINVKGYENQEIAINPLPEGETTKLPIELTPINQGEELPPGDGLSVGIPAPDFNLPDGDGKDHALADYAGNTKVVLVFYRGDW
jgi:hypothetical protein